MRLESGSKAKGSSQVNTEGVSESRVGANLGADQDHGESQEGVYG